MSYEKHTWVNHEKVTAAKLNNIEDGVEAAVQYAQEPTVKSGPRSLMPTLALGEQYLATDTDELFIGTSVGSRGALQNLRYERVEHTLTELSDGSIRESFVLDFGAGVTHKGLSMMDLFVGDTQYVAKGLVQSNSQRIRFFAPNVFLVETNDFYMQIYADGSCVFEGDPTLLGKKLVVWTPVVEEDRVELAELSEKYFIDTIVMEGLSPVQTSLKPYLMKDLLDKATIFINGVEMYRDGATVQSQMAFFQYRATQRDYRFFCDGVAEFTVGIGVDDNLTENWGVVSSIGDAHYYTITLMLPKSVYFDKMLRRTDVDSFFVGAATGTDVTDAVTLDLSSIAVCSSAGPLVFLAEYYKARSIVLEDALTGTTYQFPISTVEQEIQMYRFTVPGFDVRVDMETGILFIAFIPTTPGSNSLYVHVYMLV